jgi:hypothetical protein
LKNEKLKQRNVSNKVLPLENLVPNTKELHTQTSTPKKPKEDDGGQEEEIRA